MKPEPPGAAFFCLEPEPTKLGRSRSRLRELSLPEPPKKVAASQHWCVFCRLIKFTNQFKFFFSPFRGDNITLSNLIYKY